MGQSTNDLHDLPAALCQPREHPWLRAFLKLGAWFEHTSLTPLLFQGCCNTGVLPYKQTTPF